MTDARRVIVSGADSRYFPLLQSLVSSIRDKRASEDVDIAVIDLGLDEADVAWLDEHRAKAFRPSLSLFRGARESLKAFSTRPLLPECLPGYDPYLWMDADAWVQDWAAVDLYFDAAAGGALAIVPSFDRGYRELIPSLRLLTVFGFVVAVRGWMVSNYRRGYGQRTAARLALTPTINSGVFALRADAPHWAEWAECYRAARRARNRRGFDQVALNYAIFERSLDAAFLPAWCNWVCGRGLPKVDPASGLLVEPHPPHVPLGIVHLIGRKREPEAELAVLGGGTVRRALTYPVAD